MSAFTLLAACSGPASVKQARAAVDTFHAHYNNAENQAIWDGSSADLTGTTSQAQFFALLNDVRSHYGKVLSTQQQGWHYNGTNWNSFDRLDMKTTFEKGVAYEQFTYRNVSGSKQLLAGWSLADTPPPPDVKPE